MNDLEIPIKKALSRFYVPKEMVDKSKVVGEIPGTRSVYRTILVIGFPALVELLFTSLINFVDTFMVSGIGASAISAVGITSQPKMILLSLFMAINVGVTAIVARSKGEGRPDQANSCMRQAIMLVAGLSVIIGALGIIFARPLLLFAGANDDYIDYATDYFVITTFGLIFQTLTMTINSAQRGAGETKITLVTNTTSNVVNIIFDFFLIEGKLFFPRLEVKGAAIATSMGFFASFVVAVVSLLNRTGYIRLNIRDRWRFEPSMLKRILRIGSNAAVEQVALRVGFFAFAKIIATLGTNAFATHQTCMLVLHLSFTVGEAFSVSATSLSGQSLGQKRPDMAIVYGRCSQRLASLCSIFIFLLFFFSGSLVMRIFSDVPEIINTGAYVMKIAAFIQFFQISQVVMIGCLRGGGDNRFTAILSFGTVGIMRPLVSYLTVIVFNVGLAGAWYAILADQILRSIITSRRFKSGKWIGKKV